MFSWDAADFAEGSAVEVLFLDEGETCGLVVNHTRNMTRKEADEVRALWESGLVRLESWLEGR